ncbi:MAG: calcium/proton exchanger [Pseudanabaena sp. RU_4_16]|nr:calcium/proton exchanger [Pseudanabaena sp. RU_4_16]NKB17436.1 calcium/proton exchanger [Pseudanabaena sp. CRU_2_10]
MSLKIVIPLVLLVFVPVSIASELCHWGSLAIFITSALAIIPFAIWLGTATEKVAVVTGPAIGGLVNAVFGNATEVIIGLVALKEGLVDIVKASITGSILSELLLVLGLAMLLGGLRYKEQVFQKIVARVNGSSMTLAVTAIALPTVVINTSNMLDPAVISHLSTIVAVVLIAVYGLTLLFSLKTHSYLYDVGITNLEYPSSKLSERSLIVANIENDIEKIGDPQPNLWLWVGVLLGSTIAVALESDLFVGALEEATNGLGLTPLFTGVVLLPLIGDVAGCVTAIRVAMKNQMDLSVSISTGSSLLVALFVAPLLVLVGQLMGQPMDLNFNPFEAISIAVAVTIVNLISLGGRSNWLDGTLLLATYVILSVAFFYHPA